MAMHPKPKSTPTAATAPNANHGGDDDDMYNVRLRVGLVASSEWTLS